MYQEKVIKPFNGFTMLFVSLGLIAVGIYAGVALQLVAMLVPAILIGIFLSSGLIVVNPNESKVLTLFGKYVGTVKEDGFFWVNPLTVKMKLSLRARNLNGQQIKVNDKMGNPIEIAAVIVWKVSETAKASFAVQNFVEFVNVQSEAAVRHLANSFAYDHLDDESTEITLKDGADKVNALLESELNERLGQAGIEIIEARISHLAYAQEIASAMLQRQQAAAVISARRLIVDGAVGMVEMALERLAEKEMVILDEERKATMVSNLLVVLCSDRNVQPVVNTGTLYN
ncbi:MAG: SPFH domain-containing protein [Pedobacter sp.]|nr:MAG: SPFH domain-containing protein [Pedobacter sp.]